MIKSAPKTDKKFMASVIGRRKSREDGSVKKSLADDVRLLGKVFSRQTLVTTNHCKYPL